jgi:hypothetical protein
MTTLIATPFTTSFFTPCWDSVASEPQDITEKIYPMYPLIADPTVKDHSASGKTTWFGLVPVGSVDDYFSSLFENSTL